ncbi:MAG TPA: DUF72 domain-containing protein [Chloroflexi bacterium]|nr:DUF72 domain-containing protein [Chloroflexota bacterium]
MARIYIGTSSWSDHTNFYPDGLPSNEQITYYAQHFPIVEINSTFYRMMPRRNFEAWARRTPDGFVFDVKPYRQLTWHDREKPPDDEVARAFYESMQPLRDAGKLGAVHFQFPPWYVYRPENVDYIRSLRDRFPDDRVAVEFRHRSWLEGDHLPDLIDTLRDAGVSLTVVDEPQLGSGSVPTVLEVTRPDLVIVRFHGRNYKMWYARVKTTGERFDYLYSEEELREWAPDVEHLAEQAAEVHVLFNNNAQDYAIRNARQLRMMLSESTTTKDMVVAPTREGHPAA